MKLAKGTMVHPVKFLLADDHQLVRDGLRSLLERHSDLRIVGEAADGHQALQLARELRPDIVLMDLNMHGLNGIEATRAILAEQPDIKVLVLSMRNDDDAVAEVFKVGAKGYVPKESAFDELILAVRAVLAGKSYLSPSVAGQLVDHYVRLPRPVSEANHGVLTSREREVLQLVSEGMSSKEIASLLNLSVKTVDTHRQQIMNRLNLHSIAELTKYAIRHGLTTQE